MTRRTSSLLPKGWEMTIDEAAREVALPGWTPKLPMESVKLFCTPAGFKEPVTVEFMISSRPLTWTGKVEKPGDRAAFYFGGNNDLNLYCVMPSANELRLAHWESIAPDVMNAFFNYPRVLVNRGPMRGPTPRVTKTVNGRWADPQEQ